MEPAKTGHANSDLQKTGPLETSRLSNLETQGGAQLRAQV